LDFSPTEEQQMLRDLIERFAADTYPAADRPHYRVPATGFAPGAWSQLAELGLLAMAFPEELGGLGAGPVELMILGEALGKGVVPEPVLAEVLQAGLLLARAGTEEQKDRWLEGVLSGSAHLALAFAEPDSRFELATPATSCADGRLSGTKTCVMGGSACDAVIVSARGPDGAVGLWLAELSAPGIARTDYRLLDGQPAMELTFEGTPATPLAEGLAALETLVVDLRVAIVAEMVGLMQTMFDLTVDYVKVRKQFGAAIGSFQAIQHRLADQYMMLEQSRSLLLRAALATPAEREAAGLAAKAFVARAGVALGEEAIQLHGGMGVTDELLVGHAHKRLLLLASLFGDADREAARYMALTRAA